MKYSNDFRLEVTLHYYKNGDPKGTSRKFNVPLSTIYKWGTKYRTGGEKGLNKKSTRPKTSPADTSDKIKKLVIKIWWKSTKPSDRTYSNVRAKLKENYNIILSLPTISKIIKRA